MLYTLWDGTASSPLHKVPASEPPKLKDSPHLQNITALVSKTHHFFSVFLPGEGFHRVSIFDGLFPHGTIWQMTSSNSPVSPTTLIRKTFIRCIQQRLLTHQAPNWFSKRCHKTQYFQVTLGEIQRAKIGGSSVLPEIHLLLPQETNRPLLRRGIRTEGLVHINASIQKDILTAHHFWYKGDLYRSPKPPQTLPHLFNSRTASAHSL